MELDAGGDDFSAPVERSDRLGTTALDFFLGGFVFSVTPVSSRILAVSPAEATRAGDVEGAFELVRRVAGVVGGSGGRESEEHTSPLLGGVAVKWLETVISAAGPDRTSVEHSLSGIRNLESQGVLSAGQASQLVGAVESMLDAALRPEAVV